MDKRTTYYRLLKMLKNTDYEIIHINQLRKLVMMHIGGDERTITACLRVMGQTGLIQDMGDLKFKIIKNG